MLDLSGNATPADIYVGSTDNHEAKKLLNGCSYGMFASGYLFYLRQGMLIAGLRHLSCIAPHIPDFSHLCLQNALLRTLNDSLLK